MQKSSTYQNIINSCIATTVAEIITLPICTTKTNYQNTGEKSIVNTARKMYADGGILAFYRGSPAAVASQVLSTSSKYVFYRKLEDYNFQYSNKMLNGMLAGITSSLVTHPLDSVKIHWQMKTPIMPEIKKNGIFLLYRGYSKSFFKISIGSSLFFPLYDYSYNYFKNPFYASFTSAVISTTIISPVDYLKTRHIYGLPLYHGWNPVSYYKGYSLNLLRIVPHFMIVMTTIDFLKKNFYY